MKVFTADLFIAFICALLALMIIGALYERAVFQLVKPRPKENSSPSTKRAENSYVRAVLLGAVVMFTVYRISPLSPILGGIGESPTIGSLLIGVVFGIMMARTLSMFFLGGDLEKIRTSIDARVGQAMARIKLPVGAAEGVRPGLTTLTVLGAPLLVLITWISIVTTVAQILMAG